MKNITPILPEEFISKLRTKETNEKVDYHAYFKPAIEMAQRYAIGTHFWFIPDNKTMKISAVSENAKHFTPYSIAEWIGQDSNFLANNFHPDDRYYLLAATTIAAEINECQPVEKSEKIRVNIYCRMLNKAAKFRWVLVQYVAQYYNDEGKIESTLGLITDMSAFVMINKPMMTVIYSNDEEAQYFKDFSEAKNGDKNLIPFSLPKISKREQEVLLLMTKGLNSPKIASTLNISYHTVENHKRNLRHKTATKTSAELMHFIIVNNLF